ncbi:hypothetical protein ACFQ3W_18035 [Paenibacillus puldeungensis]|uniref:ABC-2 type transport system permease protein n=1 Tax=Paenibacillus puldeungensis TaxID=696536 RepID=A0ABW3S0H9_9BACL
MIRLLKYELKRLMMNRFFFGLLVVTALSCYQIMSGDIILGVANTAPFSGWSYGAYLSKVLPILLVALLFFISLLYSKRERKVEVLTEVTPVDRFRFRLLRYGAIIIAYLVIFVLPIGVAGYFYGAWFHFTAFGTLIMPTLLTCLPSMLFFLGLGLLAGRVYPALVFALMPVVLLLGYLPLPYELDLFGSHFFSSYPAGLSVIEPAFEVPLSIIIGRCVYALIGLFLIAASAISKPKRFRIAC